MNVVRNNCRSLCGDLLLRLAWMEIRGRWIGLILGFGMDRVGRVRFGRWVGRKWGGFGGDVLIGLRSFLFKFCLNIIKIMDSSSSDT